MPKLTSDPTILVMTLSRPSVLPETVTAAAGREPMDFLGRIDGLRGVTFGFARMDAATRAADRIRRVRGVRVRVRRVSDICAEAPR